MSPSLRNKRNLFWKLQLESNSSNPKKMWSSIKSVLGPTDRPVPSLTSPSCSMWKLRKYTKIQSKHHPHHTLKLLSEFKPVTEEEVWRLITSSPDKQCSINRLPTWILKKVGSGLLAVIYNKSLSEGIDNKWTLSHCLETSVIKPLIKKSGLDQSLLANYHPVSNLLFLSIILERVVHK